MRQDLINFIKELSSHDKKTLSEKALKMSEEVGELAKVVLPYSASHGTRHRFVTKESILEELADSCLVAMSMVYDLGFSEEDLWGMMKKKSEKWAELQALDSQVKDHIPFEIHITVQAPVNVEHFKNTCKEVEVKPILLSLQTQQDTSLTDVMTSSVFYGTNAGVMDEVQRISKHLESNGYIVLRRKVETVPWHPAAPSIDKPKMPDGCYFECHFNIFVENNIARERLRVLSNDSNLHVSKNMFKEYSDGSGTVMVTYRRYDKPRELFLNDIAELKELFTEAEFTIEKEIVEFSIFDTNQKHDAEWLKK